MNGDSVPKASFDNNSKKAVSGIAANIYADCAISEPPAAQLTAERWTCKFCHEALVSGGIHRFVAVNRVENPVSVTGTRSNIGECLNRTGHLTRHHPDAPEWNGGIDYSDGRARAIGPVQLSLFDQQPPSSGGTDACEAGTLFGELCGDA